MFVKPESAAELGTSRASMNRTGTFNAAKGVHSHYNEYKDFHSREIEAHICASFMEMCGMSKLDGNYYSSNILLRYQTESNKTYKKINN